MLTDLLPPLAEAVVETTSADTVAVRFADGATTIARVVQTSAAPPPALAPGDLVLVARAGDAAYVIGRLAPAADPAGDVPADDAGSTVHVVMPDGVDTVRIAGRRVTVAADEELLLTCGGGSVRVDRHGKVVVLGTDITSRARRRHKIKGATVAIN
jgi:hypothetical protein